MTMNTPRGYTYPCYTDPTNFPAQIQDLATDIDGDVQGIITNIADARNTPPSAKAQTTGVATAIGAGLFVPLTFATQIYDNAAMFTPPSTVITAPVEGLYLISYFTTFGAGSNVGVRAVQIGVGGFVRSIQTRRRAGTSAQITVTGSCLSFIAGGASVTAFAGSSVATTATSYGISVTRMTGTTIL
jgi:hypothetical protein